MSETFTRRGSVEDYRKHKCSCCGLPLLMPCPYCKLPLDLSLAAPDDRMGWSPERVPGLDISCLFLHNNHKILRMGMERRQGKMETEETEETWSIYAKKEWWEDVRGRTGSTGADDPSG